MSYISQREKVFAFHDPRYLDCAPPKIKRSDHRLKRFYSTFDQRAWNFCEKVRHRHFYETVSGSQTCLSTDQCHQYVPLEDLIGILSAEKDAYIKDLETQLRKCCKNQWSEEEKLKENELNENIELSLLRQELNNSREMLRRAMNKLQNIDEVVNENKRLHCRLRCSEERIKYLEEKKIRLEHELADLRSKSQIQMDLQTTQQRLNQVCQRREEFTEMDEVTLQNWVSERDDLQKMVKKLEKDLEDSKKKEIEIEILKKQSQSNTLSIEEMFKENECYRKKLSSMKCLEKQIQDLKKQGRALADKYKRESQKASEQLKKMSQATKELQALREERDSLRERVSELACYENQFNTLQRKLQCVDTVIAENEKLNSKLTALSKMEEENEYLRCKLEKLKEMEISAIEDKERIRELQYAVADQEEEMKDLLCQIEMLTNGRTEEELQRLRCELYEKNSKLKLCEEQLAEIPMLEAEIDELRTKLQTCNKEYSETKTGEYRYQKIEVRLPTKSTEVSARYKNQSSKPSLVLGMNREEKMNLSKASSCSPEILQNEPEVSKSSIPCEKKQIMSCEDVQNLLQSSKGIISCVLEDMIEHQKEMEELELCNKTMKDEIEILKAKIGSSDKEELLEEISHLKECLEEKNLEISKLKENSNNSSKKADELDVETLKELNQELKAELEAAYTGLKQIADLEKLLQLERKARCEAENLLREAERKEYIGPSVTKTSEEDQEFDCCKSFQKEIEDLKLQILELNKLTEELKKENHLLRELQQPCPDFSKELDEKCALENLLSLLQAELDAFKGQKLSDECEALRNELKRVMEQNCQLKALVNCYRQRLDLEKKSNALEQTRAGGEIFLTEPRDKEKNEEGTETETETKTGVEKGTNEERERKEEGSEMAEEMVKIEKKQKIEGEEEEEGKLVDDLENKEKKNKVEDEGKKEKEKSVDEIRRLKDLEEDDDKAEEEEEKKRRERKESEQIGSTEKTIEYEKGDIEEEKTTIKEIEVIKRKQAEEEKTETVDEKKPEEAINIERTEEVGEREEEGQVKVEEMERAKKEEDVEEKRKSAEEMESKRREEEKDRKEKEKEAEEMDTKRREEEERKKNEDELEKMKNVEELEKKRREEDKEEMENKKNIEEMERKRKEEEEEKRKNVEEKKEEKVDEMPTKSEPETKTTKDASSEHPKESDLSEVIKEGVITKESPDKPFKEDDKLLEEINRLKKLLEEKDKVLNEQKREWEEKLKARDADIQTMQETIAKSNIKDTAPPPLPSPSPSPAPAPAPKSEPEPEQANENLLRQIEQLKKEKENLERKLTAVELPGTKTEPKEVDTRGTDEMSDDLKACQEMLRQMEAENAEKLKKLMEQYEKELSNRDKIYNDNLNAMKSGYETDIRKMAERHKASIMRLQALHEDEVQEMSTNYETQMEAMQQQTEVAIQDLAKDSAVKLRKLSEQHDNEMKAVEAKFSEELEQKESQHKQELKILRSSLTKSAEGIERKTKDELDDNISELKTKHSREMQKLIRSSMIRLSVEKSKYEALLEEQRQKSDAQLETFRKKLREQERGDAACQCKFSKKKPRKPRDPTCPLDFNEILEKILEEGIESLTFNEIALVHRKTCCALEGIVMNSNVTSMLEPPIGDVCPHTPLLQADKEQLLNRIFALENEIVLKQRQTQETIVNMEVAIKKEKCRLQELKNLLENEQQKNSELKSLLTNSSKLQNNLKTERDKLGNQIYLHQSLFIQKNKQLDREKQSKKCLEEELEKLRLRLNQLSTALNMERENSKSIQRKESDHIQALQLKLEQSINQERKLALQLENEAKYRDQLQYQLQALGQSFKHMVHLPAPEKDSRVLQNPLEAKSAKEKQNLDQIKEKKSRIKPRSVKKPKK